MSLFLSRMAILIALASACSNPNATTNTCSAANCAGCCNGDVCQPGDTTSGCGTGGSTCEPCTTGMSCNSGLCASSTPVIGVDWKKLTTSAAFGGRAQLSYTVHNN